MALHRADHLPKGLHWYSNAGRFDRHVITPACLCCGQPTQYTRTIPRLRRLPELRCYECRRCHLGVTEEYAE